MTTNHFHLSKEFHQLVELNSDLLAEDMRVYLEQKGELSHFNVQDVFPELYNSLIIEIIENFKSFNIENKYCKEIISGKYSLEERKCYYGILLFETASKLMTFCDS